MPNISIAVLLTALLGVSALRLLPSVAHASPTLISVGVSSNGGAVTTVATDGGTGAVTTGGSIGNFQFLGSAFGSPYLTQPNLDTATMNVSASGGGTFDMFITEQGLTSPQGSAGFLSSFTVNLFTGGISSVTEETFIDTGDQTYSGILLSAFTDGAHGLSAAYGYADSPLLSGPFSETIEYIVTAGGAGATNDTVDLSVPVPEPATFGILVAGLGVMALIAHSRARRPVQRLMRGPSCCA